MLNLPYHNTDSGLRIYNYILLIYTSSGLPGIVSGIKRYFPSFITQSICDNMGYLSILLQENYPYMLYPIICNN